MAWTTKLLVISSRTLSSDALLTHMVRRTEHAPTEFTIVVPGGPSAEGGGLRAALERFRAHGLAVDICIGDRDPLMAVRDHWSPSRYDEIVVVTLPSQSSRWLASGLPSRVQRATGALVTHVVAELPAGMAPVHDEQIAVPVLRAARAVHV
jgi:hypothetical protein